MTVERLMTANVFCCRTDEPASAAARVMWDHDCGVVVVVARDGRAAGMITDRDICMATWMQDRPPSLILAADVMSRELYACAPGDPIAVAKRLMRSRQVRRIPVLDGEGRPVGILSLADLVREAERPQRRAHRVVPEEIATTLAEICQPRDGAAAASLG